MNAAGNSDKQKAAGLQDCVMRIIAYATHYLVFWIGTKRDARTEVIMLWSKPALRWRISGLFSGQRTEQPLT